MSEVIGELSMPKPKMPSDLELGQLQEQQYHDGWTESEVEAFLKGVHWLAKKLGLND